jgi:3-hydroxyacyl-CoA dehydrogenase/enoyl-CoA hydratase/3-hydroxybutyryl-CoA epimerase
MPESAVYVIEKMAHGFRRKGRATGAGFYDYEDGRAPALWSGLSVFARGRRDSLSEETITQRLMLIQSLMALRRAAAGSGRAADIDREACDAWGYPAHLKGPIAQAVQVGQPAFDLACQALADRFGERFKPVSLPRN